MGLCCQSRASGRLYDFHQLIGHADLLLDEAAAAFESSEHASWAKRLRAELIGIDVLPGRWTLQILEEFNDGYYHQFAGIDAAARIEVADNRRHVLEAEMKAERQSGQ